MQQVTPAVYIVFAPTVKRNGRPSPWGRERDWHRSRRRHRVSLRT